MAGYLGCHMYSENEDEIIKPATDVFEINDFTAATEWENFIDDIENIFRNWKLSQTSKKVKVSHLKNDHGIFHIKNFKFHKLKKPILFQYHNLINIFKNFL